jgi:hypothetical protein
MDSIIRNNTQKSPKIEFDAIAGKIEIKGRSILSDSKEFYEPLIVWLDEYSRKPKDITKVNFQFEYFNASSAKYIFRIFMKLELIAKAGSKVHISWLHKKDDEDMIDAAEDIQAITNLSINLIEIE